MKALILLMAVACGAPTNGQPAAAPTQPTIDIPDTALPPRGTLLIGDLHGTREIPTFVGQLVTAAAARAHVVLLLEIPSDENPSLQAFMASDGSPAMRARLVGTPWWQSLYQDGRRSVAMADLIETARALRAAGRKIDLIAFDAVEHAVDREEVMARNVIAARRAHADSTLIVYAGNLHTSRRELPFKQGFAWMAMRVANAGIAFVSLNARWPEGTAWTCRDGVAERCGVSFLAGTDVGRGIHVEPVNDGQYDGWFGLASVTASPPAGIASKQTDLDAAITRAAQSPAATRAKARRAYDQKRYGECAELFAQIESPDAGTLYDHACCLALSGRKQDALAKLEASLAAGFDDFAQLAADADLASLRDDPRWPTAQRPAK
jgi:hypothetical protein